MIIMPAVDLKGGKCVRLLHGDKNKETIYSDNPVEVAKRWVEAGAKRLHVIDLDGAFQGTSQNLDWAERIKKETNVEVQLGGGLRTKEAVERVLSKGIDKVILGTVLFTNDALSDALFNEFKEKIIVAVDVRGDQVSIKGWESSSGLTLESAIQKIETWGGREIIYTDIGRDGTLKGVNLESVKALMKRTSIKIYASGGVSTMKDIDDLLSIQSPGCIVGKAIYEGTLNLKEAFARVQSHAL